MVDFRINARLVNHLLNVGHTKLAFANIDVVAQPRTVFGLVEPCGTVVTFSSRIDFSR